MKKPTSIEEFYELNKRSIKKVREEESEIKLIDEHEMPPDVELDIDEIGARSVSAWIRVKLDDGEYKLNPKIEANVNLRNGIRGLHMSRHIEAIYTTIAKSWCINIKDLHRLGDKIACNLLELHDYSTKSMAQLHMHLPYYKKTGNDVWCENDYEVWFLTEAQKSNEKPKLVKKSIKISVDGLTVCPTGQTLVRSYYEDKNKNLPLALFGTHMQRARGEICIEITNNENTDIEEIFDKNTDIQDIFDISKSKLSDVIESSMSSSAFNLIKRLDEQELIVNALKKPKFIEDCIRCSAENLVNKFPNIPGDAKILIFFKSLESFHQYDLYARLLSSFSDLKNKLEKGKY